MNINKRAKILSITPISHIRNVEKELKKIGELKILNDPSVDQVKKIIHQFDAIFTNPNKSKVFIGKHVFDRAEKLKVICTASTGTNHIDLKYANKKKIKIISLKKEKKIINKISSTSEHALALTLASLRNVVSSNRSVLAGKWNYMNFISHQINFMTIGIIGYGRLGKKYANYCRALGSKIIFYDPYKKQDSKKIKKIDDLNRLLKLSDIISIHVHLDNETYHKFDKSIFKKLKKDVIIVNTSRGDVINEDHLVGFLKKNKKAKFAADVIENEIFSKAKNRLLKYAKKNPNQVIVTPHIGGMTSEAQQIAYSHSVKKLGIFLKK